MDDLFSHLERELSEPENERTVSSFWRCVVRPRLIKRTVTTHNDELSSVLRHPWGLSWRKAKGKYWCPICCSLSAEEMLKLTTQTQWWNPVASMMEFHKLVERGEMDSSSRFAMYDPPPGYGYGLYSFTEGNEPVAFTLVQSGAKTRNLRHLFELLRSRRRDYHREASLRANRFPNDRRDIRCVKSHQRQSPCSFPLRQPSLSRMRPGSMAATPPL